MEQEFWSLLEALQPNGINLEYSFSGNDAFGWGMPQHFWQQQQIRVAVVQLPPKAMLICFISGQG